MWWPSNLVQVSLFRYLVSVVVAHGNHPKPMQHVQASTIPNLCDTSKLSANIPWTCPSDRVFFDASVIWGLNGPRRILGNLGEYINVNWFFLGGAVTPMLIYLTHKVFLKKRWILMIHMPVLLGSTSMMPLASSAVNYTMWAFLFLVLHNWNISLDWLGNQSVGCSLAGCPTTKGVKVDVCPVF